MGNLRTVLAVSAAGVVAALLFAACNEPDPQPTDSPTASATPTASASATPSASPTGELTTEELLALLPEDARYPDLAGAIKTAEFFFTQYAPMFHSGNTVLWDALSLPGCVYCVDASSNATLAWDGGWTATGGEITPDVTTEDSGMNGDHVAVVTFEADFADAYLAEEGSTPELQEPASRRTVSAELKLVDDVWRVSRVMVSDA